MSYTTGTTHYNLPQTVGTDKRDWADTNQAFQDIDAAIYGAVQDTAQAASDIDALEARMDTAEQNIATNTGDIAGLDTRLTTAEGAITSQASQITDTRQDLEDMICAFNEASATSTHAYSIGDYFIYNDVLYKATQAIAIGDTIVPDTNCATTNVSTELLSILARDTTTILADIPFDGIKTNGVITQSLFTAFASSIPSHNYEYEVLRYTPNRVDSYTLSQENYSAGTGCFFNINVRTNPVEGCDQHTVVIGHMAENQYLMTDTRIITYLADAHQSITCDDISSTIPTGSDSGFMLIRRNLSR